MLWRYRLQFRAPGSAILTFPIVQRIQLLVSVLKGGVMKPKVLLLCTGNSARSQMAEGYLRHVLSDQYESVSAGIEPKGLNPLAVEAMLEVGIDISQHKSKDVAG